MSQTIHKIYSHEHPDLDSILCIYLLKRYGAAKYEGIEEAALHFFPAGKLPNGKSPEELEEEGILVVDMGGGRLDTHPTAENENLHKSDTCAAMLVARDLGLTKRRELKKLLTYVFRNDVQGRSISSGDPVDHAVSLTNILRGTNLVNSKDYEKTVIQTMHVFDSIVATEKDWFSAIDTFDDLANIEEVHGAKIVTIESRHGATIKASRWKGSDFTIFRHADTKHTTLLLNNRGALKDISLIFIAEKLRRLEALARDEEVDDSKIKKFGKHYGWFLHTSDKLLLNGSPKAPDVEPSKLSLEQISEAVIEALRTLLKESPPVPKKPKQKREKKKKPRRPQTSSGGSLADFLSDEALKKLRG